MDYRAKALIKMFIRIKTETQLFRIDVFILFFSTAWCWRYRPKHVADCYMNKTVGCVWTGHTIFVTINKTENVRIT